MYKIYGITQGQRTVDLSNALPWAVPPGNKDRIDFFFWCIKGKNEVILLDTGMTDADAEHMCNARLHGGSTYIEEKLRALGVNLTDVHKIIVSHLHGDHFSAFGLFPNALFYIQKKEIEFFTGPGIKFRQVAQFAPDMAAVMKLAYAQRIRYLDGDEMIAPGIKAVLVGGHTPGSQIVSVTTVKGQLVLCADAMDRYQNMEASVIGMAAELLPALFALDTIKKLASSPDLIIPGHDPLIMTKFPSPMEGVVEIG